MTEEEKLQNGENATRSVLINKELIQVESDLEKLYTKDKDCLNAMNLYIYGVILKQRNKEDLAK